MASSSYFYSSQQRPTSAMHHQTSASAMSSHAAGHGGRSRRGPRLGSTQPTHKPFRGVRSMKELHEAASIAAFRTRFEAGRSFDLDDDLEFCPALLTEDDFHYMSSPSSSDRSSLSSNSPDTSPLQQQARPSHPVAPTPSLPAAASPFSHLSPPHHQITTPQTKLHQPAVARARNPIPIVNPHTGMRLPSRPDSISPALSPFNGRRW
ncbi:MAG: hypothetical protein M1815_005579 [Lichina confinis]|nr:MAG: hypothetical protein M1815_005579 [Lichina confinis]